LPKITNKKDTKNVFAISIHVESTVTMSHFTYRDKKDFVALSVVYSTKFCWFPMKLTSDF